MTKNSIFSKIHQSIDHLVTSSLQEEADTSELTVDPIIQYQTVVRGIQQLELQLDHLTATLRRGELPVNLKKVTQVFDGLVTFDRLSIDIPANKFIELYNDLPNILSGYAIDATLSDESYRQINNHLITFHRLNRGTYWIFPTARIGKQGAAWLVPNPLKQVQINRSKSISFCFDVTSLNSDQSSLISLGKPALVKILPNADRSIWKLLERGELRMGSAVSPASTVTNSLDLPNQIEQIIQAKLRASHDDILKQCQNLIDRSTSTATQSQLSAKEYFDRGKEKERRNDLTGALLDYNSAIEVDPNHANAYFNRGMLKKNSPLLKDKRGAIASLRTAARLYKQQGRLDIYQSLSETLEKLDIE